MKPRAANLAVECPYLPPMFERDAASGAVRTRLERDLGCQQGFGLRHCPKGKGFDDFGVDPGRNRYLFCGGYSQFDFKVQHGGLSHTDSDMNQKVVDLAMVGNRQPRQPSGKQLIRKRHDCFRQRSLRHTLAFSSRR